MTYEPIGKSVYDYHPGKPSGEKFYDRADIGFDYTETASYVYNNADASQTDSVVEVAKQMYSRNIEPTIDRGYEKSVRRQKYDQVHDS